MDTSDRLSHGNGAPSAVAAVTGGHHAQDTIWATSQTNPPPITTTGDINQSNQQQAAPTSRRERPPQHSSSPRGSTAQQQQQQQQRRVCVACRRRKVGCNKQQPCQHCKKTNSECIYLPEETQASKQAAIGNARIWEQLRRLEPMFQTLADRMEHSSGGVEDSILIPPVPVHSNPATQQANVGTTGQPSQSPAPPFSRSSHGIEDTSFAHSVIPDLETGSMNMNTHATMNGQPRHNLPLTEELPRRTDPGTTGAVAMSTSADTPFGSTSGNESTSTAWSPYGATAGQLVRDDGRHRYVSGRFWEVLHHYNDDESSQDAFSDISDYDEESSPPSPGPSSQYSVIFGMGSQERIGDSLHPPLARRLLSFQIFKENVHPLISVLHLPSIGPVIQDALRNIDSVQPAVEALLFVIYFSAVSSLSPKCCEEQFGGRQTVLQGQFRKASENAFAKARLMATDDILVLQAFVIYLVVLRPFDPTCSWNLTGLAVRLAQAIGLHRDGNQLNLSPFDAEIRRRLWWALCVLDAPAAEDHLCTPPLLELSSVDANPPLNLNDADLHPEMDKAPAERIGATDSCFNIAQSWVSNIWRTIVDTRRVDIDTGKSFRAMTVAEKETWVEKQHKRFLSRFFGNKPPETPLHHLTSSFIVTIFCGLRLFIYNPLHSDIEISEHQRKDIFNCAVECMSHSYRMRTDPRFSQWAWLLKTYNEWHAFAVVLSELCNRPLEKEAQRAWRVVEQSAVLRLDSSTRYHRVHQWRSVMKTIEKARRRRRKVLARRRSSRGSSSHHHPRQGSFSAHNNTFDRGRQAQQQQPIITNQGTSGYSGQSARNDETQRMQQDAGSANIISRGSDLVQNHHHRNVGGALRGNPTHMYSPSDSLDPLLMDSSQFLDPSLFNSPHLDSIFAMMNGETEELT